MWKQRHYSESIPVVPNKIWYFWLYSSCWTAWWQKKVVKVKFQVLFPAVTRGEHNYKPGTVGNWAHADGSKSKPGTCFFGQSASDVSRRNTETELNWHWWKHPQQPAKNCSSGRVSNLQSKLWHLKVPENIVLGQLWFYCACVSGHPNIGMITSKGCWKYHALEYK